MKPSPKKDSEECPDGKDRRPSVTRWGVRCRPECGRVHASREEVRAETADAVFDAFGDEDRQDPGREEKRWDGVSRLAYMCPYHLYRYPWGGGGMVR